MINDIDVLFYKSRKQTKCQLLAWWLNRVQLEEHRTADVTMVLEVISSEEPQSRRNEWDGWRWGGSSGYSRCYLKKDAMWRRAKCLWVAVTWLVPFLPGSNSGACSGGFSSSVSASSYEQRLSLSLINRPSFKWANRMLRSESSISPSLQVLNVKMLTYFFVSSLASSLRPWWGLNPGLVHGRQESYH